MKQRLTAFLCALVALLFLFPTPRASAAPTDSLPQVDSTAGVVYNLETDRILFDKNFESRINPAAFTKLMTALLAFEYRRESGNHMITVTEEMLSSAGGTSMKLKAGEVIDFDSLLAGLVVQNANDAALVLASRVGGNISAFVERMNQRAKELGMEHTYYSNPTGVDTAVMYTTLKDTLVLCKALYRVNDFMVLSEKPKVSLPSTNVTGGREYTNKNALIPFSYVTDYYMEGVRGMAAGYTGGAGYCVATVRKKGNATFMVILSGGKDRSEKQNGLDISSYRDAKNLLEWAESSYSMREVMPSGQIICEKRVRLGQGVDHMILVTGESKKYLLPTEADLSEAVETKIQNDEESYTAPIIKGEEYAKLEIYFEGELLDTVPLMAQSNVGLSRWLVFWDAVTGFFSQGPAKAVLILVISGAVLYVLILIGTVWLQYARKNRARAMAIAEINEQENRRMEKVRMEERKASQARMRRVRGALREGFKVLSGETEVIEAPRGQRTPNQPHKAVAKVPEKYRKENHGQVTPRQAGNKRPASHGESYRVTRSGQTQKREVYRTSPPSSRKTPPNQTKPNSSRPKSKS